MSSSARNCVRQRFVSLLPIFRPSYSTGKEKKRIEKTAAAQQHQKPDDTAASLISASPAELRAAIEKVKAEQLPDSPDEKERYFMTQVNMGEDLCQKGTPLSLLQTVTTV
jgi:hypothetical protein